MVEVATAGGGDGVVDDGDGVVDAPDDGGVVVEPAAAAVVTDDVMRKIGSATRAARAPKEERKRGLIT